MYFKMSNSESATPSPIPTPSSVPYSLSERINIATRPVHSQLNRLILVRLPLALPPHTTNPSTYVSGLLHVAPIYITFESLWQSLLDAPRIPTNLSQSFPFESLNSAKSASLKLDSRTIPFLTPPDSPLYESIKKICPRTQSVLSHLQLPGLQRADRLRADIRVLTGTHSNEIEMQLAAVAQNGRLAEFIAHMKRSVDANPHVLLAYAWVLYMALFSGGRYLRASLKEAGGIGPNFWDRDPSPVRPYSITQQDVARRRGSVSDKDIEIDKETPLRSTARSRTRSDSSTADLVPGMQFFNFSGDSDGEDIKILFKTRLTEAEILLTEGEKEDIVDEAQHIFNFMVALISDLDSVMGTKDSDLATKRLLQQPQLLHSSRDSVSVARERLEKQKTNSMELGNDDKVRKPSFLDVLVTGPVAKFVQFKGSFPTWHTVTKPLSRQFSMEGLCPASVSFSGKDVRIPPPKLKRSDIVMTRFVFLLVAFLMLLLAWCVHNGSGQSIMIARDMKWHWMASRAG